MRESRPWLPWFILVSAIWGSSFLWIKIAVTHFAPLQVAFGRIALGAATLLIYMAARRIPFSRRGIVWAHCAGISLVQHAIPFTLFAWGEQHISSVLAGIWNASTPLWTVLVAFLILPGERPRRSQVLGVGIGFLGVLVVLGVWEGVSGDLRGSAACLGATLCYATALGWTRRWLAPLGEQPATVVTTELLCASAVMAVVAALVTSAPSAVPLSAWAALAVLGVVCTGAALLIHFRIILQAGALTASAVTYLTPLFSTLLGVVALGESLSWHEPVGGVIILAGVALVQGLAQGLVQGVIRRREGLPSESSDRRLDHG